jgi:plastocyanin
MHRLQLVAGIGLGTAALLAGAAAAGSASSPKEIDVSLTANGPEPSAVTKAPYEWLEFANHDSVEHSIVLMRGPHRICSLHVIPGGTTQCRNGGPTAAGKYTFTADGTFDGTVNVVAYPRSVSLTGDTHTIRAGRPLTLHGRLRVPNGAEGCGRVTPFQIRILDRHRRGQSFRRIAVARVRTLQYWGPSRGLSSYGWRLTVRPGTATTYIAETVGQTQFCQAAHSRPFAVAVRR